MKLHFFLWSQRPDQANGFQQPQAAQAANGNGINQDSQSKNGKSDSKMEDYGNEFFDAGERSIFDGDDFELVGMYLIIVYMRKFSQFKNIPF